jgi:hypothetical protein
MGMATSSEPWSTGACVCVGGGGCARSHVCPWWYPHQRRKVQQTDPLLPNGERLAVDLEEESCFLTGGGVQLPTSLLPKCQCPSILEGNLAQLTSPLSPPQLTGRRQDTFSPQNMQNGGCHEHWVCMALHIPFF